MVARVSHTRETSLYSVYSVNFRLEQVQKDMITEQQHKCNSFGCAEYDLLENLIGLSTLARHMLTVYK